ncbi:MAG: ferritin, partial [Nitrosarchaeum sp.]
MKISQNTKNALNNQIVLEANAANNYLAMASWCEITGYSGAAKFFYAQSDEERSHMLKFIHYLNNIGGSATIPAVKSPGNTFKSLESIIRSALTNEQLVTKAIHNIVDISQKEKDHATHTFLDWFINEQVEEEKKFETIL